MIIFAKNTMKDNKRFQECSLIVKLWRYRWYILIPFKYLWYQLFGAKECIEHDETFTEIGRFNIKGRLLWSIMKSEAQSKMNWYYTTEEVFNSIKDKYDIK